MPRPSPRQARAAVLFVCVLGLVLPACSEAPRGWDQGGGDAALDSAAADSTADDGPTHEGKTDAGGVTDSACASCWTIPESRLPNWNPGHRGPIPTIATQVNVKDHGARADGTSDDAVAMQAAIDAVKPPGAVLLPAGTYMIKSGLKLRSGVVIRGEGADKTHILANIPSGSFAGAIGVRGGYEGGELTIIGGVKAGATTLEVSDASSLKVGQSIWVYADNDAQTMYTDPKWDVSWAAHAVGQIVNIKAIQGQVLTLDVPIRLDHPAARNARLRPLSMVENFGIEALHIKRLDQAEDYLLRVDRGRNGWIRDCHLEYCTRGHLQLSLARHITVSGNTMHHAYNYGGGGHGYGVQVSSAVSDCLIEDNIFYHLRHSMLIQLGANGNVFAYNYSYDRHNLTDISIHGHFSYMNLFEGNVVEEAVYADYWGPTGPQTTMFRNRVKHWVRISDGSQQANVVGNTIEGILGITVLPTVSDALVEYNLVAGKLKATQQDVALPPSLWRQGKPSYWGQRPWPCTGADVDQSSGTTPCEIPAQTRAKAP